jgi:hypothetical protein
MSPNACLLLTVVFALTNISAKPCTRTESDSAFKAKDVCKSNKQFLSEAGASCKGIADMYSVDLDELKALNAGIDCNAGSIPENSVICLPGESLESSWTSTQGAGSWTQESPIYTAWAETTSGYPLWTSESSSSAPKWDGVTEPTTSYAAYGPPSPTTTSAKVDVVSSPAPAPAPPPPPPASSTGNGIAYATYHNYDASTPVSVLACSDGSNGLISKFNVWDLGNMFPGVMSVNFVQWNSPLCGQCVSVTGQSSGKTGYVRYCKNFHTY